MHFFLIGVDTPIIQKPILKCLKRLKNIKAVHPYILYSHTNFRDRMALFVTCIKKTIFRAPKWLLTRHLFLIFTQPIKMYSPHKTLCKRT
jgi:hypothetical protein